MYFPMPKIVRTNVYAINVFCKKEFDLESEDTKIMTMLWD
jgi:hypothetical protein